MTPRELRILDGPLSGSGHGAAVTVRWHDRDGLRARYIRLSLDAMPEYRRMIAHELLPGTSKGRGACRSCSKRD